MSGVPQIIRRNAEEGDMVSEMMGGEAPTITPKYINPLPMSVSKKVDAKDVAGMLSPDAGDLIEKMSGDKELSYVPNGPEIYVDDKQIPALGGLMMGDTVCMMVEFEVTNYSYHEGEGGESRSYSLKMKSVSVEKGE